MQWCIYKFKNRIGMIKNFFIIMAIFFLAACQDEAEKTTPPTPDTNIQSTPTTTTTNRSVKDENLSRLKAKAIEVTQAKEAAKKAS